MQKHPGKCDIDKQKANNKDCVWGNRDIRLSDNDFRTVILKMFKELKETMFKELKKYMIIMTHERE